MARIEVTKLKVLNRALLKLGLPLADSLANVDWNAEVVYEDALLELQRGYPWNFCKKYVTITPDNTAPVFGFTGAFPFPSDCNRIIDVHTGTDLRSPQAPYDIVGRVIYANAESINLRYCADLIDPATWPFDFLDAVSYKIAAEIAALSAQKFELVPALMQLMNLSLQNAQAVDARETAERVQLPNALWQARALTKG